MQEQESDTSETRTTPAPAPLTKKPQWLALAIGSGAFAAFNGVFAKLTTGNQSHFIAVWVSHLFGLADSNPFIELPVRGICLLLNFASNAVMWVLFTKALAAATSSTRVSVLNVSSNFFVTALLGMIVFSEGLPLGWWLGASLLVVGCVVIGAREGAQQSDEGAGAGDAGQGVQLDSPAKTTGLAAGGVTQSVADAELFMDEPDDDEAGNDYRDEDFEDHDDIDVPPINSR